MQIKGCHNTGATCWFSIENQKVLYFTFGSLLEFKMCCLCHKDLFCFFKCILLLQPVRRKLKFHLFAFNRETIAWFLLPWQLLVSFSIKFKQCQYMIGFHHTTCFQTTPTQSQLERFLKMSVMSQISCRWVFEPKAWRATSPERSRNFVSLGFNV